MDRRRFLRNASLLAAGAVALDQLEVVEKVGRRFWPAWGKPRLYGDGIHDDTAALQWYFDNYKSLRLPKGNYLISDTVKMRGVVAVEHSRFVMDQRKNRFRPWLDLTAIGPQSMIHHNSFNVKYAQPHDPIPTVMASSFFDPARVMGA